MKKTNPMNAQHNEEIVIIDAPIVDLSSQVHRSGVIYSISLDNGTVITSPESFEALSISEIKGRARTENVPPALFTAENR